MTSPEQKERHIKAWETSGLSQVAYCREHGLNIKTFGNWLRAYRDKQKYNPRTSLMPVTIKAAAPALNHLKLRCSSNHILELPADISPQWLGELLKCLD